MLSGAIMITHNMLPFKLIYAFDIDSLDDLLGVSENHSVISTISVYSMLKLKIICTFPAAPLLTC